MRKHVAVISSSVGKGKSKVALAPGPNTPQDFLKMIDGKLYLQRDFLAVAMLEAAHTLTAACLARGDLVQGVTVAAIGRSNADILSALEMPK